MKINDILLENTMKLNLGATTKDEVIDELIDLLFQAGRIKNKNKFKKEILAREELSSTGVGDGVAIPHAKDKNVIEATLAFGISKQGIDYDSMDKKKAHIFFMIAAPYKGHDIHLEALSQLARMLIYEDFREALMNAKTKEDIINLINQKQE